MWELGPPHFRMLMHSAGDEASPLQSVLGGAGDESSPLQNAVRDAASALCAAAAAAGCAHIVLAAVTAAIAPLLGLLGTVTGIIKTFKLMNVFGAGDPKPLISGISQALITTELGLILAIPALILHALLSRKVAGVLARMEKLGVAFMNSLARGNRKLV